MPSRKKNLVKTLIASATCSCGRPKPSHVHHPTTLPTSSSFSCSRDTRTSSKSARTSIGNTWTSPSQASKIISASIAVVKDSDDPYRDFRHSMLQMIFEKEISSKHDLHQLLNCFLDLNSPSHHPLIIQVFTHICSDIISKQQSPTI